MQKRFRIFYSGDVNIEHGGLFYSFEGWQYDYVDVVRVTPCSDAGGPDNCFWVSSLTVNLRESERQTALDCIGITAEGYAAMKRAARRHAWIEAAIAYGYYDCNHETMIRIGKPDQFYSGSEGKFEPDTVLRGNTSLFRYARQQFIAN